MRVALIVTEIGAGVGGRFTFQEMVSQAVAEAAASTPHEFRTYSAGISRFTEASVPWRARRVARVGTTLAVQAARDAQDAVFGKRLVHPRTPLERRLHVDGIDLVWFPTTYAEDVDQPYICTVFDLEHRTMPWFPETRTRGEFERRERFYKRYLPKATRVIVPNETARDQARLFYGVSPEHCLLLGHPTPSFALEADSTARANASPERPFLLYPAQFWPHKNHAATLDALAELHARDRLFDLVLVGSDKGQEARFSREVRRRGLDSHVRILGFVTTEELIELYRSAHALLFLSRFGPENLPPLEAMALGCPAVVADVPGAREQYGDAALIVDPRSPGEVADALESLDEPPVRDRLVAQGLSRARSWTARDYVQGVLSFLDEFEIERRLWSA